MVTSHVYPDRMSERLRLGIIGLGAMGRELLTAAQDHPDVVVRRAADLSADAVALAQAVDSSVSFGTEPSALIEDDELDALYVASPPASHASYVVPAMAHGKHVLCEKPLAISPEDAEAMLAAERDSGLVGGVNYSLSDRAAVLEIERAISAGEVGDIISVHIDLAFPEWPREFQRDARWVAGRAEGGFLREVLSHFIYVTHRLVGPTTVDTAAVTYPPDAAAGETSAFATLFASTATGRQATVTVNGVVGSSAPEIYEWTLLGERRSYRLTGWSALQASGAAAPGWSAVELTAETGSERTRLSAFAAAVSGRRTPNLASFADAHRVQQTIESLHASRG